MTHRAATTDSARTGTQIFVGEPGEERPEKDEAAHQQRHGGGARRDVGGKERPGDGRDEQGGDDEGVGDRQRQADLRRHPPRQNLARPQEGEERRADQEVESGENEDLRGRAARRCERHGLGDDAMRLPEPDQDGGEGHGGEQARNPFDRPFQVPPDFGGLARVDLRPDAAGEHPGVGTEHPPRGVVDRERPDEDETGEEPQPVAPGLEAHRQDAEGHVGEQVARLGRHEEQERAGEHAEHADPAGDENPRRSRARRSPSP